MRPGVEPSEPGAQPVDLQIAPFEVAPVDVGDLQLAAGARLDLLGNADDVAVVEVEPRHSPARARTLGLLLDGDGAAALVQGDDAVAFGIGNPIPEDRGAPPPCGGAA